VQLTYIVGGGDLACARAHSSPSLLPSSSDPALGERRSVSPLILPWAESRARGKGKTLARCPRRASAGRGQDTVCGWRDFR
jgi:hypothetical protein